jgi:hypothetical protein
MGLIGATAFAPHPANGAGKRTHRQGSSNGLISDARRCEVPAHRLDRFTNDHPLARLASVAS